MTLLAPLFLIMAAPVADAPQPAPQDQARVAALCLAAAVPGGAQVHAAADGSFRVTRHAPRRAPARWTVSMGADGVTIAARGAPAGLDRALRSRCAS